ncbi:28194_t:CDS:2 [Dentiscutata erythropus]|uniref:28194_t:CDS:1 n=1 Tax=Dentiscutata erythropus TaxID=1348616 RepID=A0A9N9AYX1_9GLOM|nr:28194_t:CDS:2 [Dentiscutata erythropus]
MKRLHSDNTNKSSETNGSKILDEMGGENRAIIWKNINTRLESIFGSDKYPVELWKEKAENTFASIIQRARGCEKKSETRKKNVDNKRKKILTANNNSAHNDDEDPVDNNEA